MSNRTILFASSAAEMYARLKATSEREGGAPYLLAPCPNGVQDVLEVVADQGSALLVIGDTETNKLSIGACQQPMSAGKLKVLVVSNNEEFSHYTQLLELGCVGLIPRKAPEPLVFKALEAILGGELWVPRTVLSRIVRQSLRVSLLPRLTLRESEILHYISIGLKNQEIADRLFVSRDTVRWHIRSLYSKIGARNRHGAVQYALHAVLARES